MKEAKRILEGRQAWRPGNMLYPLPAVMVSAADKEGNANILTVAWTGTVCSDPAMLYISVRPERYSYHMIRETGEFVVNLTTEKLAYAPVILESPVNIECRVTEVKELGSHHMFLADVTAVQIDERYMKKNGKFMLNSTGLLAYSHGEYRGLGKELGSFGWSVKKR